VLKIDGFDTKAYQRRLILLREIISGENQTDFAARLGIPMKRWSNYERGYPIPRETAFVIMNKFPGMSVEWIWFGAIGNLSEHYRKRIETAEKYLRDREAAEREVAKAQSRLADVAKKKARALPPARMARAR
jgi:hypothetical protein